MSLKGEEMKILISRSESRSKTFSGPSLNWISFFFTVLVTSLNAFWLSSLSFFNPFVDLVRAEEEEGEDLEPLIDDLRGVLVGVNLEGEEKDEGEEREEGEKREGEGFDCTAGAVRAAGMGDWAKNDSI